MTTLILADDHPLFLAGLRAVLDAESDLQVLAVATTGEEALRVAMEHQPDVAVLDIAMPDGDGLSVSERMREAGIHTHVLILTMSVQDETVLAALRAGARGYAVKNAPPEGITAAVRAVARGEAVFGAGVAERMLRVFVRRASAAPFPQLTEREHEVLRLMAAGHDNTALSRRLGISGKTVRNHVSTILAKLQVADRTAAVLRAHRAGLGPEAP